MSYLGYVAAAYAVFVIGMLWDYLAPKVQLARVRREARLRVRRDSARRGTKPATSA